MSEFEYLRSPRGNGGIEEYRSGNPDAPILVLIKNPDRGVLRSWRENHPPAHQALLKRGPKYVLYTVPAARGNTYLIIDTRKPG